MLNKKLSYLFETPFYKKYARYFAREVAIITIVSVALLIVSIKIEAFEELVEFVEQHEDYELDELVMLVLISSVAFMIITIRNIKYLKREIKLRVNSEKELNKMAFYDALTGLPNRALCHNRLEQFIAHANRNEKLGAVLFIDLDNFKDINDTLGHTWGDELLKQFAERLQARLRVDDTVARISGDEFTIIIDSPINTHSISVIADKLLADLATPFVLDNETIYTSMSMGVAVFPTDANTADDLLKCADTAMYSAKHEGKGQYRFYSVELEEQAKFKLNVCNKLRRAIELNEFTLNYQPVLDVNTRKIKGAEALLRWHNKELGIIGPDIFIPFAEEIGIIHDIGNWVLTQACWQTKQWHLAGYSELTISVNMSSKQLVSDNFLHQVNTALAKVELPANSLELELTETAILSCVETAIKQIEQLKQMGISIALDDFGTGYSSMSYLVKLKIDRLKVDKSFIDKTPDSKDDVTTTKAIISLANNLNLQVTAEGIETEEQYNFIKSTSCNAVQGYYFSHPLTAENFKILLEQ